MTYVHPLPCTNTVVEGPADHVPDWQPRVLLGMVEARSVNVKKTTTPEEAIFCEIFGCALIFF